MRPRTSAPSSTPRASNWCEDLPLPGGEGQGAASMNFHSPIRRSRPTGHSMTGSAYFMASTTAALETHTLVVEVDNEPGVLARVVGLFSGRGYNIESLTVSETQHAEHV